MTANQFFHRRRFRVWAVLMLLAGPALPQAQEGNGEENSVAMNVEQLRKQVIELNRDLFVLEEDLLFPASTRFVVFLSVETGEFLALDAVKLKVDDEVVASHLYTDRQVDALCRGGMQRLHMGNLKTGKHEVTVFVDGIGPENRSYRKAATYQLDKDTDTAALEVRIRDRSSDYQPAVELVEWE
ncbi:AraC family transcriptional regulator [Marinobacter sp.]|uniref:AraC family transcriptional regulator n=1 Tax=Marinobacter sp. TaxID=50741 RepID=UPI003565E056